MRRGFFAGVGAVALAGLSTGTAHGEDLVTLSGATYHDIHAVRADPDGVTWRYEGGLVKVDFADCPENVRRAYHYDPAKAEAFRETQARARQQADEQNQKLVRDHEKYQRDRIQMTLQNTSATVPASDGGPAFNLRHRLDAESAAATVLDEQAQAKKAAHDLLTKDDGTVWDRRLWKIPSMIFGYSPGVAFEPGANLNPQEFKASVHHAPGGFAPTAMQDSFNTPMYMTRSYYEDVERSEAFARGVPLKAK